MTLIYRCNHCNKDIITKLPKDGKNFTHERPYLVEFDRFIDPQVSSPSFLYRGIDFHICCNCIQAFYDFFNLNVKVKSPDEY